jgi:hypothetical protein
VLRENLLADKALVLFLEDVAMANDMDKACVTKDNFHGLKVYRHDAYKDTLSELRKALSPSGITTVINVDTGETVHFQEPKGVSEALKALDTKSSAASAVTSVASDKNPCLSKKIKDMPSSSAAAAHNPDSTEVSGDVDDTKATVHTVQSAEVPNTPGDSSTFNSASPRQASTVGGASTSFIDLSMDISELPVDEEKSVMNNSFAQPNCRTVSNRKVIKNSSGSNNPPNSKSAKSSGGSNVSDKAEKVLQTGSSTDKIDATGAETTNSMLAVESGSVKKKKKGSKRTTVHKGKGAKNTAESSSGEGNQASYNVIVSSNQGSEAAEKLDNRALPGAHGGAFDNLAEIGQHVPSAEYCLMLTLSSY